MKKQILFLTFFTLAILFAGIKESNAQLLPSDNNTAPSPLSCEGLDLPLHPLAGVPYTYKLSDVSETGAEAENWTWFATKNPTFINGGAVTTSDRLGIAAGQLQDTDYGYNTLTTTAAGGDSVSITWTPEILAATEYQAVTTGWATADATSPTPTFVVAYAESNCTDNIQVYEINPVTLFTVDIANIAGDGTTMAFGADTSQCVSPVQSAIYNGNIDNELQMDYGLDTMYFEVVAANFVTNWDAYINVSGWTAPQTATMSLWPSKANMDAESSQIGADYTLDGTEVIVQDLAAASSVTSTVGGVSMWIRIIIDNNEYESLASQPLTITIDGQDTSGQWDMADADCSDPESAAKDQVDLAQHTVTPRPAINHDTDDDGTNNANDVVPKEGDASYTRY